MAAQISLKFQLQTCTVMKKYMQFAGEQKVLFDQVGQFLFPLNLNKTIIISVKWRKKTP